MNAATVRYISANTASGSLGVVNFISGEHRLPPGATVVEVKYCENCMRAFSRPVALLEPRVIKLKRPAGYLPSDWEPEITVMVDTGQRYCGHCRGRMLMPEASEQEQYKEQMPAASRMLHSTLLPRYDDSLSPRQMKLFSKLHSAPAHAIAKRKRRDYGAWKYRVSVALRERGPLSLEQIQEIIGCPGSPATAGSLCHNSGLKLQRVGSAPRRVPYGPAPGLYALRETSVEVKGCETTNVDVTSVPDD